VVGTDGGEVIFHKPVVYQPEDHRHSSVARRPLQSTTDKGQRTKDGTKHYVDGRYVLRSDGSIAFQVASYDPALPLVIDPTLAYSTYLGGNSDDEGYGVTVDASGNAYVTGTTFSSDFPTTTGALQSSYGGNGDVFVSKLNAAGSALVYSTYLGGRGSEGGVGFIGKRIAVDASGNAYVTGYTSSSDFPTTPGAFQTTYGGNSDVFVSKLNPTGSSLVYSTYLGGSGPENGDNQEGGGGIAVDASGNAYVTGDTDSSDFPTTPGALRTTYGGNGDAFVSKLNAAGSSLVYST